MFTFSCDNKSLTSFLSCWIPKCPKLPNGSVCTASICSGSLDSQAVLYFSDTARETTPYQATKVLGHLRGAHHFLAKKTNFICSCSKRLFFFTTYSQTALLFLHSATNRIFATMLRRLDSNSRHISRVAPDWDLNRLSYSAAAKLLEALRI